LSFFSFANIQLLFVLIDPIFLIFAKNNPIKYLKMAYKISEDCTACGTCIDECPVEAISPGDIYKIDPNVCTDCGTCADVCPVGAISQA
jgi:ferredoxin